MLAVRSLRMPVTGVIILQTLTEQGIAENTLVIWSSDNGPHYSFHPHGGYSLLPGGKGETLEGGVRVPSIAWWPGMINEGQDPLDIVSISDWFTTMVRVHDRKFKILALNDSFRENQTFNQKSRVTELRT